MNYTIKDILKDLECLTLDSPGGKLKKYFPPVDPNHMENLREKIMKKIGEIDSYKKATQSIEGDS